MYEKIVQSTDIKQTSYWDWDHVSKGESRKSRDDLLILDSWVIFYITQCIGLLHIRYHLHYQLHLVAFV